MSQSLNNLEQMNHHRRKKINEIQPPKYETKMFKNMDDLVAWVQSENIDEFQEGRYRNGISSLRKIKKILSPSYPNHDITLRFIEVLPDDFDSNGYTVIAYYYYTETQRVVIFVRQMNEKISKQAHKNVNSYFAAKYDLSLKNAPVFEAKIEMKDKDKYSFRKNMSSIPYVKTTVHSETSDNTRSIAYFLSDGFELAITQAQNVEDERFINEICLESVEFNK